MEQNILIIDRDCLIENILHSINIEFE